MLTQQARSRLTVVLVGARNPQNIGAAARAMQDFGFGDLRIVNAFTPPFEGAQLEAKSAVGAAQVMADARRFDDLGEAIRDCHLVVGTTAVGGREPHLAVVPLQQGAQQMLKTLCAAEEAGIGDEKTNGDRELRDVARVALLFGSEKTGLTNEQLSYCQALVTIPLFAPEGRHLSMNLGQSVAVCLYELTRGGFENARPLPEVRSVPASVEDRERLLTLLQRVMEQTGYSQRFPANARVEIVRSLVHQLASTRQVAFTWMGLFRMALDRLPASTE